MPPEQTQPLILTLRLDAESQGLFDEQRKRYFPPERNFLKAHLTLFHQLPDMAETFSYFENFRLQTFPLQVTGLFSLGAGVAYRLQSETLSNLHRKMAAHFKDHLIPQDRQPFRPHITIQNKVTPPEARVLLVGLSQTFTPFTVAAIGLDIWRYMGGPWEHVAHYAFAES